ncbi:MAG: tetratricopeptide repeat protein [Bacteroidales bacterium]
MEERTKYNNYQTGGGKYSGNFADRFDDDFVLSPDDQSLFNRAGDSITALSDIEEIRNDPGYESVSKLAPEMIREYRNKPFWSRDNSKFVIEAFEEAEKEKLYDREISEIRREAYNRGDDVTAAIWVDEWNKRKNADEKFETEILERKEYISSAMADEISESETKYSGKSKNRKILKILGYSSLPAAAAVCIFIVLKFLASPASTDEMYIKYYQPAAVVSPITRGTGNDFNANYSTGIEKYRNSDYADAAFYFELAMKANQEAVLPKFYYAVTQIALGNYSVAADYLDDLAVNEEEYGKESQWYLGLAYLRMGEKDKAWKCFKALASSPGFYREKAARILRRLK